MLPALRFALGSRLSDEERSFFWGPEVLERNHVTIRRLLFVYSGTTPPCVLRLVFMCPGGVEWLSESSRFPRHTTAPFIRCLCPRVLLVRVNNRNHVSRVFGLKLWFRPHHFRSVFCLFCVVCVLCQNCRRDAHLWVRGAHQIVSVDVDASLLRHGLSQVSCLFYRHTPVTCCVQPRQYGVYA